MNPHSSRRRYNHSPLAQIHARTTQLVAACSLLLSVMATQRSFARDHSFTVMTNFNTTVQASGNPGHGESQPNGPLVAGPDGTLYGAVSLTGNNDPGGGHGGVYKLVPDGGGSATISFLHLFDGYAEGSGGDGLVYSPNDGYLYGTTNGNYSNSGTVFKLSLDGSTFVILHTFNGSDGSNPQGQLTIGTDGNFYGTTFSGGSAGKGVVYQLTPAGAFTVLKHFQGGSTDGGTPTGGLASVAINSPTSSVLYGVTRSGGAYGWGTIYSISYNGVYTTLHNFGDTVPNGINPFGGLTLASDGYLYGECGEGGLADSQGDTYGLLYRINAQNGLGYSVVYDFPTSGDGYYPQGGLATDTAGFLYGVCRFGGPPANGTTSEAAPGGTVFQFNTGTFHLKTVHAFYYNPSGGVVDPAPTTPTKAVMYAPSNHYNPVFGGAVIYGTTFNGGTVAPGNTITSAGGGTAFLQQVYPTPF